MKILITGVNGFLGQFLATTLLAKEHTVVGLGRKASCLVGGVEYISGSVLDKEAVGKAMEGVDAVVHLAALTAHADIIDNKFDTLQINLLGTKNVLDVMREKQVKKFLYASTGKVYGEISSLPITEEHVTKPLNVLGRSKLLTENLINFYSSGSEFVIFRIFNVYGPKQKDNFLVPTILSQLREGESEITLGDISAQRDYTYVDDVIKAFVLALEKQFDKEIQVFNICSGRGASAKEIVDIIGKHKEREIIVHVNSALIRKDEKDVEYGSFAKAQEVLGWKPTICLEEGLGKLL
jgi:nucleoside-diphosphate-sugar epimerase